MLQTTNSKVIWVEIKFCKCPLRKIKHIVSEVKSAMRRIEFTGGSAIGKSTVLKAAAEMRKPGDKWLTAQEARIIAAKSMQAKSSFHRLIQIWLKLNLVKKGQDNLASKILRGFHKDITYHLQDKYSDLAVLFLNQLLAREDLNPIAKLRRADYYYDLLLNKVMLFEYLQFEELIVYDEGIVHSTAAFRSEDQSGQFIEKHLHNETGMLPTAIVYCYLDEEKYIQRVLERAKIGKDIFSANNLSSHELQGICHSSLLFEADMLTVMKNHNIPVLEINMADPVKENAELVYHFIKKL